MKPRGSDRLSRRRFLRAAAAGLGGAVLSACARATGTVPAPTQPPTEAPAPTATDLPATPTAEVTVTPVSTAAPAAEIELTTSGWPVEFYSRAQTAADPAARALQDALQVWLEGHPGVRLNRVNRNIWDPAAVQAEIAAGTESTYLFGPTAGGGWDREQAVEAFRAGRLADVTGLVEAANLRERILPDLWANWSAHSQVDGKFFAYPLNQFTPATQVFVFRKDLALKKRLDLPTAGWTWQQAAGMFTALTDASQKRFGFVAPPDFLRRVLAFHGAEILTWVPAPDAPSHWLRDWSDPRWAELIDDFRRLVFSKKSIQIDPTIQGASDWIARFRAGETAFALLDYAALFGDPADPESLPALAAQKITTFDDLFGMVPLPTGDGYQEGGEALWGPLSFGPNQSAEQLALGADLIDWMFFGEGLDLSRAAIWKNTGDPRSVFRNFLFLDGRDGFNGVPAKPADAWGEAMVEAWWKVARLPVAPRRGDYFDEPNPLPSEQPLDDFLLKMVTDSKPVIVSYQLAIVQEHLRAAALNAPSAMDAEAFRSAARAYYDALGEHLQRHMPDFYHRRFVPFAAEMNF